jgi:hypothetical protein
MSTHQFGYNFHPNDRVWSYDSASSSFNEGTCYQVYIKVFTKADLSIDSKLIYLIMFDDNPTPLRLTEDKLYILSSGGLVRPPLDPIYQVSYDFYPNDVVWVINRTETSVKYGIVYQADIEIFLKADLTSEIKTSYLINFSDALLGTPRLSSSDIFLTSTDAWAALGIVIGPPPTPVPTGTPLPSTESITVTKTNSDNVILYKGTPVYIKANGTVGRSNSDATALVFLGFVADALIPINGSGLIMTEGTVDTTWGSIIDGGVLQSGSIYYLSHLGTISATAPDTGFSKQVGIGVSSTELNITLMPTYEL